MPEAQYKDRHIGDFVAQFIIPDDDAPNFARRVGIQFLTNARIIEQSVRCACQLLDHLHRSGWSNRAQVLMQSNEIV